MLSAPDTSTRLPYWPSPASVALDTTSNATGIGASSVTSDHLYVLPQHQLQQRIAALPAAPQQRNPERHLNRSSCDETANRGLADTVPTSCAGVPTPGEREPDYAKAEAARLRVEVSRLQSRNSSLQQQCAYLQEQLLTQQKSHLAVAVLEERVVKYQQENDDLRKVVEQKDHEMDDALLKLHELQGRVAGFEAAFASSRSKDPRPVVNVHDLYAASLSVALYLRDGLEQLCDCNSMGKGHLADSEAWDRQLQQLQRFACGDDETVDIMRARASTLPEEQLMQRIHDAVRAAETQVVRLISGRLSSLQSSPQQSQRAISGEARGTRSSSRQHSDAVTTSRVRNPSHAGTSAQTSSSSPRNASPPTRQHSIVVQRSLSPRVKTPKGAAASPSVPAAQPSLAPEPVSCPPQPLPETAAALPSKRQQAEKWVSDYYGPLDLDADDVKALPRSAKVKRAATEKQKVKKKEFIDAETMRMEDRRIEKAEGDRGGLKPAGDPSEGGGSSQQANVLEDLPVEEHMEKQSDNRRAEEDCAVQ